PLAERGSSAAGARAPDGRGRDQREGRRSAAACGSAERATTELPASAIPRSAGNPGDRVARLARGGPHSRLCRAPERGGTTAPRCASRRAVTPGGRGGISRGSQLSATARRTRRAPVSDIGYPPRGRTGILLPNLRSISGGSATYPAAG